MYWYIRIACVRACLCIRTILCFYHPVFEWQQNGKWWRFEGSNLGGSNRRNRKFGQIHIQCIHKNIQNTMLNTLWEAKMTNKLSRKVFSLHFVISVFFYFSFSVYTECVCVCARILKIAMLRNVKDCWEFLCVCVYRWLIKFYGGTS